MSNFLMSEFRNPTELMHAVEAIRPNFKYSMETYSPFPIHGMDHALGEKSTALPWLSLSGGLIGMTVGMALQIYTSYFSYPIYTSGKELISLPAFIPVTFEVTILFTAFATVFGMFGLNQLPKWHSREFNYSRFDRVTSDGFFLLLGDFPDSDKSELVQKLESLGGQNLEDI